MYVTELRVEIMLLPFLKSFNSFLLPLEENHIPGHGFQVLSR